MKKSGIIIDQIVTLFLLLTHLVYDFGVLSNNGLQFCLLLLEFIQFFFSIKFAVPTQTESRAQSIHLAPRHPYRLFS